MAVPGLRQGGRGRGATAFTTTTGWDGMNPHPGHARGVVIALGGPLPSVWGITTTIGDERRNGYSWYGEGPRALLEVDYPAWKARLAK